MRLATLVEAASLGEAEAPGLEGMMLAVGFGVFGSGAGASSGGASSADFGFSFFSAGLASSVGVGGGGISGVSCAELKVGDRVIVAARSKVRADGY